MFTVTLMPHGGSVEAEPGASLLSVLAAAGLHPDAPCGGHGTCGKCKVIVDGAEVLACRTQVWSDMTVVLPTPEKANILSDGLRVQTQAEGLYDYVAAFDIGTTTLVGFLLDGKTGTLLASASDMNPQIRYGADVISRIQAARKETGPVLQSCILKTLADMTHSLAASAGISAEQIRLAAIVGNTAMHHLLLGIDTTPLVTPPYMPRITEALDQSARDLLPIHPEGTLRVLPNIAGFVGADTVACMTAARFGEREELTLMIDIGTNGEMVLGNRDRRVACSTAAGPALEGAKISQGMRGCPGAIDRVWLDSSDLKFHVIGDAQPMGICGSGLLDLIACLLKLGIIFPSGRMPGKSYTIPGTKISLTQKDVREVQLAKAAIRAGIELLCAHLDVTPEDIQTVLLAGAFGNYTDPHSACRIGLIPPVLLDRIRPIGNAAGEGAKLCALSRAEFAYSQQLARETEFLELASKADFQKRFISVLGFEEVAQ